MTEDDVLELLDEARLACGRKADALAAYCGARIPNSESVARFVVEGYIHRFTGKHVKLPAREELVETVVFAPAAPVLASTSTGCSWCRAEEVILGGVVCMWAADRGLSVCNRCATRGVEALEQELCTVCGKPLKIGEQGCIYRVVPHEPVLSYHPFIPYFDVGLGRDVTSLADRWNGMKAEPGDAYTDGRPKLEYRDHPSKGDLAARRDRLEERKREQRRGNSE